MPVSSACYHEVKRFRIPLIETIWNSSSYFTRYNKKKKLEFTDSSYEMNYFYRDKVFFLNISLIPAPIPKNSDSAKRMLEI